MTDLVLNARFLMRQPTGVDRVATELIPALAKEGLPGQFAALRAVKPAGPIVAPNARPKALHGLIETSTSRLSGHAWEQLALLNTRPHDILLSLCNMGPVLRRRQVVMFHDAQAFRAPESYSRAFRTWYHALQPRLGRRAALVLTVSEHSRRELEHFGIVPPGQDTHSAQRRGSRSAQRARHDNPDRTWPCAEKVHTGDRQPRPPQEPRHAGRSCPEAPGPDTSAGHRWWRQCAGLRRGGYHPV